MREGYYVDLDKDLSGDLLDQRTSFFGEKPNLTDLLKKYFIKDFTQKY
jgi:hypothetical protein